MELIYPGSVEADSLRKRMGKLSNTKAQIARLLRQAKSAFKAGRYTQPSRSSALNYYQQVLKIDSSNARAKFGIEEIIDFYKSQFDKAVDNGDLKKAEHAVNILSSVSPNSSMVVAMYKKLEASQPPPKPEIEAISDIVSRFNISMEASDIKAIRNMSVFEAGRGQFVDQFFANYKSLKLNISNFQYIANKHKANVHASLNRLTNKKGNLVQPGAWGEFDIVIKQNKNKQWRVYW
jgi:hypothetical protein